MLKREYETQHCSLAGSLEVIGERWTLLIVRNVFLGIRRFDDLQRQLGIARNVLTARLDRLVDEGILRRQLYQERPERYEYRLTRKGVDLWPVVVSLLQWGDRHVHPDAPPLVLVHKDCGGGVDGHRMCAECGAALEAWDVEPKPGPGATSAQKDLAASLSA